MNLSQNGTVRRQRSLTLRKGISAGPGAQAHAGAISTFALADTGGGLREVLAAESPKQSRSHHVRWPKEARGLAVSATACTWFSSRSTGPSGVSETGEETGAGGERAVTGRRRKGRRHCRRGGNFGWGREG